MLVLAVVTMVFEPRVSVACPSFRETIVVAYRQVPRHQPRYPDDNDRNNYFDYDPAKIDSDQYLDDEIFPDKYRNVNVYTVASQVLHR